MNKKNWQQFDISDMALFTGVQYSRSLIYHLLPNVWKASYTISASICVDVRYWPLYSTDKFISCVVPGPSQWFFHFGEDILIAWTHIGWVRRMFQNLPLRAVEEVRVSSGVTPCIVKKNDMYHQVLHAVPKNIVYYGIVSLKFWSRGVVLVL